MSAHWRLNKLVYACFRHKAGINYIVSTGLSIRIKGFCQTKCHSRIFFILSISVKSNNFDTDNIFFNQYYRRFLNGISSELTQHLHVSPSLVLFSPCWARESLLSVQTINQPWAVSSGWLSRSDSSGGGRGVVGVLVELGDISEYICLTQFSLKVQKLERNFRGRWLLDSSGIIMPLFLFPRLSFFL